MAVTVLTDVVVPEVLSDLIVLKLKDMVDLIPALFSSDAFPVPEKGTNWEIPYEDVLPDLETFLEGVSLTAQAQNQDKTNAVVRRAAAVYGRGKIVKLAAHSDPMNNIASKFTDGPLRREVFFHMIATLEGAIPTANRLDGSAGVAATAGFYNAKQKIGDQSDDLKWVLMHSKVFNDLAIAGEIIYQPAGNILSVAASNQRAQVLGELAAAIQVPTIAGMIAQKSDLVEVIAGTPTTYTSYLLGEKAMGFFIQQAVNIDQDRDIFLKEDFWSPDLDNVMTLFGMDYTSTAYGFTDLKNTANWGIKWDQKLIKAVRYLTQ